MSAPDVVAKAVSAQSVPARRRLAPNVFCMFAEDRSPIAQCRPRRLPRGVARIRLVDRIKVGALAEIVASRHQENVGARVLVTRWDQKGPFQFEVKSLDGELHWTDRQSGERGTSRVVWCRECDLRRLWTGRIR